MEKIFVIEDEPYVKEDLVELLSAEGYTVSSYSTPVSALIEMRTNPPDLILSDLMMPYINGYEFYKTVREKLFLLNIPFLFLTARTDKYAQDEAMELGADDFITKPYQSGTLLARIKTRLEKKQVVDAKFEKLKTNIPSMYLTN